MKGSERYMSQTTAINGVKLHEVKMPIPSQSKKVIGYQLCTRLDISCSGDERKLALVIPVQLGMELYRSSILPQDKARPVLVSVDDRSLGWFVVDDVRYPTQRDGLHERATIRLVRAPESATTLVADPVPLTRRTKEPETYVTDIRHYVDEKGALAELPKRARKLASFLAVLIEAATMACPVNNHDSSIRCCRRTCGGSTRVWLASPSDEIAWRCPVCERNGVIRNWQGSKWDRLDRSARSGH